MYYYVDPTFLMPEVASIFLGVEKTEGLGHTFLQGLGFSA